MMKVLNLPNDLQNRIRNYYGTVRLFLWRENTFISRASQSDSFFSIHSIIYVTDVLAIFQEYFWLQQRGIDHAVVFNELSDPLLSEIALFLHYTHVQKASPCKEVEGSITSC